MHGADDYQTEEKAIRQRGRRWFAIALIFCLAIYNLPAFVGLWFEGDHTGKTQLVAVGAAQAAYDPKGASEATGETIEALNAGDREYVKFAAIATNAMHWCGFSGHTVPSDTVQAIGVNRFDFKLQVRALHSEFVKTIEQIYDWETFCGTDIFMLFGPDGHYFVEGGRFAGRDPWVFPLTLKPGMSEAKLKAEVELTVAYYGAARCGTELDYDKEQAFKEKHGLDREWYAALDQAIPLTNEAFAQLGPESEMQCEAFLKNYDHLVAVGQ
ncbi:hypothetical protein ACKTEK_05740 [Tepidamorphus sp. 3E244]|uniref:hypothetical protein n=1 Tax=Tepidamorphus sp. 3E244 TaxID=3385498 RepID=UPI0038FD1261